MTNAALTPAVASVSHLVAAEIRAELARQGRSQRWLAGQIHQNQTWVSVRISRTAYVDLTVDEIGRIAEALDVPVERLLSAWLPRLDSNQQPSGYRFEQVRRCPHCGERLYGRHECPEYGGRVIDLAEARIRRAA